MTVPDAAIDFARSYIAATGEASPGMCHAAAWNVRNEFGWHIITGVRGGIPHHWNLMPDGRWFDATAEIFGDNGPQVVEPSDPRYAKASIVRGGTP